MPSTRRQPLNPVLVVAHTPDVPPPQEAVLPPPQQALAALAAVTGLAAAPAAQEADEFERRAAAARAGGFHESSYELRLGLEISESVWPDEAMPVAWTAAR